MNRRTINGLNYINHDTTTWKPAAADEMVNDLKATGRYVDAFHDHGYVWVARCDENPGKPAANTPPPA